MMSATYEMHRLTDGERLHVLSADCWCGPVTVDVDAAPVDVVTADAPGEDE